MGEPLKARIKEHELTGQRIHLIVCGNNPEKRPPAHGHSYFCLHPHSAIDESKKSRKSL